MTRRALRPVVEVGFGSGPTDPDPEWTDITDLVWGAGSGPELGVQRGRSGERAQLQPGSCTFVLDNTEGVFDPDNAEGPFFGRLVDGVPIRVRAASSDAVEVVWRGWVEAWPQVDSLSARVVEVDCLDVVGLLAQGDAPTTAFEALVSSLSPEPSLDVALRPSQWWRPGPSGWTDRMARGLAAARHSGGLVEMDPLVDGDERTWGNDDPDGFAEAHGVGLDDDEANPVAVSAWFRFDPERAVEPNTGWTIPNVIVARVDAYVSVSNVSSFRWSRLFVAVTGDLVSLSATVYPEFELLGRRRFTSSWQTAEKVRLIDGKAHHLFVVMHPISGLAELWLDGRRVAVELTEQTVDSGYDSWVRTPGPLQIGVGDRKASVFTRTPYLGAIDHVMIWPAFEPATAVSQRLPVDLFEAGRLAWAGQRLDERLRHIAVAMNVDGLLGHLDVSGITTRHGYRQSNPLELLQKIEDTEQGRIWVDRHGRLRFSNRRWPSQGESASVQAWFSDDPTDLADGALPMSADHLQMGKDPRRTTNVAQVTSEHGRMQTWEDRDSIAVRGRRNPVHLSGLMHSSDRESLAIAQFIVATSSEPAWRVDSLTFRAEDHPDLAALAQQIEEGWLVKVTRSGRDVLGHVTSIRHHVDKWGWTVTLALDSTRAGLTFFRADVSTTDGPDVAGF